MKKFFNILLLTIIPICLTAQNSAEARNILDKAYNLYEQSKGIKLSFSMTISETNGTSYEPQSGTALIKGNKFKIETDLMETWFDGKTQWVLMKDADEVNVSNPTSKEIAAVSPLALLGMYKSGYTLGSPTTKTLQGKQAYQIKLTPTTQQGDYKHITVTIDKQSYSILQVDLTMKNNSKSSIEISNYNANNNFSDATFIFNKSLHPAAEIIDLR